MDWIWQNRQWLFSGVGLSAVAALFWIFKRALAREVSPRVTPGAPQPAAPLPALAPPALAPPALAPPALAPPALVPPATAMPPSRFTKPTPHDIREQIRAVPPFQQQNAKRAFEGLKVCWLTEFSGVEQDAYELGRAEATRKRGKKAEIPWVVTLYHPQGKQYSGEIITCYGISLSTYPQLKFAHANTPVVVSGTIRSLNIGVELIAVTLEFPEATGS